MDFLLRFKFLLLLLPGFYTASMDLTIVATAQPFIASHFRKSRVNRIHVRTSADPQKRR